MTDKEIIIDGVDVSEWTDEEVRYKFEKHSPKAIRQIAFDLYKQLKRKEQECEELRGRLNTICFDSRANNNRCISYNRMAEDYAKLIKYKTLFLKAREIYQRTSKYNQQLIEENEDLKDTIKRFTCQSECYKHKDAEKYKQALEKIGKFINNQLDNFGNDVYSMDKSAINNIQDIINNVKEK